MKEVMLDFSTIPIAGTEEIQADFAWDAEKGEKPIRRRILAVSEGTHNRIKFDGQEIERMVKGCVDLKAQKKTAYIQAPITVGHTDNPLMKFGTTYDMRYDPTLKAAIADVELWPDTGVGREAIALMKRDPDNTFFSVRVLGKMDDDGGIHDLKLIHIANVLQPADSNAKMLRELSDDAEKTDLSDEETNITSATEDLKKKDADLQAGKAVCEDPDPASEPDEIDDDEEESKDPVKTKDDIEDADAEEKEEEEGEEQAQAGKQPQKKAKQEKPPEGAKLASDEPTEDLSEDELDEDDDSSSEEEFGEYIEESEEQEDGFDQPLYKDNEKQSSMTGEIAQRLIDMQRVNDRLVADLEEATHALSEAQAVIEDLQQKLEVAEEKGALIAEFKNLNLAIDQDFIASLDVDQLHRYLNQMKDLSAAQKKAEEKKDFQQEEQTEDFSEDEDYEEDQQVNLSTQMFPPLFSGRGRARQVARTPEKARAGKVQRQADLSYDEQATQLWGDYNPQNRRF